MPKLSLEEFKRLRKAGISLDEIRESQQQDGAGSFVAKDILGAGDTSKEQGFLGSLVQKTVGSKGLAGVGQLPGRTIASSMLAGGERGSEQARAQLSEVTTALIRKVRTLPDSDPRKAQLQTQIQDNMRQMGVAREIGTKIGESQITPREAIGTTLNAAATVSAGLGASTAFGRVLLGTTIGAGAGAGSVLSEGGSTQEAVKSGLIGAATGFAVSGVLEGLGSALKFIAQSKRVQRRTGYTYNKELQPPIKEVAQDIKNGFETFGEKVASSVDDQGNPIYVGTYRTMLQKAKEQLRLKGGALKTSLETFDKTHPEVFVTRQQVTKGIYKAMQDVYSTLDKSQINKIAFEMRRIPPRMNLTQLEKIKRMFDGLIPDSFWSKVGEDPALSFPSLVRYILRDNARKVINETSNDVAIQGLNNAMGVAMDVRQLSAAQLARRASQKVSDTSGPNPFSYMLRKLWDDVIFNPAITTRTAQGLRSMGSKTGQTPLRQLGRQAVIRSNIEANQ